MNLRCLVCRCRQAGHRGRSRFGLPQDGWQVWSYRFLLFLRPPELSYHTILYAVMSKGVVAYGGRDGKDGALLRCSLVQRRDNYRTHPPGKRPHEQGIACRRSEPYRVVRSPTPRYRIIPYARISYSILTVVYIRLLSQLVSCPRLVGDSAVPGSAGSSMTRRNNSPRLTQERALRGTLGRMASRSAAASRMRITASRWARTACMLATRVRSASISPDSSAHYPNRAADEVRWQCAAPDQALDAPVHREQGRGRPPGRSRGHSVRAIMASVRTGRGMCGHASRSERRDLSAAEFLLCRCTQPSCLLQIA